VGGNKTRQSAGDLQKQEKRGGGGGLVNGDRGCCPMAGEKSQNTKYWVLQKKWGWTNRKFNRAGQRNKGRTWKDPVPQSSTRQNDRGLLVKRQTFGGNKKKIPCKGRRTERSTVDGVDWAKKKCKPGNRKGELWETLATGGETTRVNAGKGKRNGKRSTP